MPTSGTGARSTKSQQRTGARTTKSQEVFHDRREMYWYFQDKMARSYRRYAETGESNSLIKTFLVEYDGGTSHPKIEADTVRAALTIPGGTKRQSTLIPEILPTDDSGLFIATWNDRDHVRVFVDTAAGEDARFWTCYSLSDADTLDVYFDRLAYRQPKLDRIWLWPSMLSNIQRLGEFRGVGIDYDRRRIEKKTSEGGESTDYFKFQIWGGPATRAFLEVAQQREEFMQQAVLSKVRLKYSDSDEPGRFSLDDIKYNGKFTARGPDFHAHLSLLSEVKDRYRAKVLEIEQRYAITEGDGTHCSIKGEPLFFTLGTTPIEDLDVFCDVVFSGGPPFHIWGLTDAIGAQEVGRLVHAVDMHTGSKLFFEIYPDLVVMYLYAGGCGNTVIRFFTNLQRMFGALVRGENNESQDIFK